MVQNFCELLRKNDLRLPFETITREDRLDESIIEALADIGCHRLWIGAESGSQRILDAMERQTRSDRIPYLVQTLRKYGIESGLFIMFGYDGETWNDLNETMEMLRRAQPDIFLHTVAYPIKGTPFYDRVADRLIVPGPWETITDRQLGFKQRPSRNFYRMTSMWMVHTIAGDKTLKGKNDLFFFIRICLTLKHK